MRFEGTSAYVATDDLKVAVNAAVALERPLLVKGEPGTGKTVLALEIAAETLREHDPKRLIPPLHGALIKNEQDVHLFERLAFMSRREGRQ